MKRRRRYPGSRLLETRSSQGIWEVTLYTSLPSTLASHLITHNGNKYRPLIQTATCLYHDEETNISQKTVDRSVVRSLHYSKKRARARLCKVMNARAGKRTEKRIQHKVWLLSIVIHWFLNIRTCSCCWATGRNTCKFNWLGACCRKLHRLEVLRQPQEKDGNSGH